MASGAERMCRGMGGPHDAHARARHGGDRRRPRVRQAARAIWPATRIQRRVFHAFCQVRRCTTSRPKLDCGIELYGIARRLLKAKDADSAAAWLADYAGWCAKWDRFLREFTLKDGRRQYVHERLRKARHGLSKLVRSGELFTFVEMAEERDGLWDSTNNMIEGGVNARLREMLRVHRGLSTIRRIKAIFWWCYLHTEKPLPPARSCASCRQMIKWTDYSHRPPASAIETTEHLRNTVRESSGASSTCPLSTDSE